MKTSEAVKSNYDVAPVDPVTERQLGHHDAGLPMTMRALLEVLESSAPSHPLRAMVEQALEADSFPQMRAALASWYQLPRYERDLILR